jgi:acyl-CoA synthetase (AMP-forming)/AMP-acid ligase II
LEGCREVIFDKKNPPKGTIRDWIDFHADQSPDVISHHFLMDGTDLTWAELRNSAKDIALKLTSLGIAKGESVALCKPNSRNAIICLYGILYGGFRATPLNLAAGPTAMAHAISHSKCRYVFLGKSQTNIFTNALLETDARPCTIPADTEILFPGSPKLRDVELHDVTETDHALLMYTSGTTGLPKGVVHTQSSLLAGGWTTAVAHNLKHNDRAMCVLPFFHINGLCVTLMAPMISGGTVAIASKFSNSTFWNDCDVQKVTWFSIVPTIISHLLHSDQTPSQECKKRIRFGRSASAPLAPETQKMFEEKFGIPIIETMGLTETAAQILSNPLPPEVRKIGSPGKGFGNQVAILDHEQKTVNAGIIGELAVRGPNVLLEYLDNEEATKSTFTKDGWLRTGDIGYIDDDGYVFVTGRLKELIIKGGENIAPREIDDALYCHKDVVEAAAFARPCKTYGQRVEAAVRLCAGSEVTSDDLIALCETKLGKFKSPDFVHLLAELPKGASGKIQRLKLAELIC